MADLYGILEVSSDASQEEIKRAYRRKAQECHPDAGGDEEEFKSVTHAYEVLSDPESRRRYDRFGEEGRGGQRRTQARDPFAGFGGGIDDVIDAFFGTTFGQGGGRRRQEQRGGRDVLVPLELTLRDVVTGGNHEVEVEVGATCESCGGSGSATGEGPSGCTTCGGSGQVQQVVRTAFGQLASAAECPDCDGTGRTVSDPCPDCGGDGRQVRPRTITVKVPPGIEDGDRLKVGGAGEAGRLGAPAGDLYVEVRVADHEFYDRDGRDLHGEVTIPLVQAALGAVVTVPSIDGEEDVEVEVPAGTQPGGVVSTQGAGLPRRGGAGVRGNLHMHVQVEIPRDLDGEQQELIHRLAELRGEHVSERDQGLMARLREAFQP